MGNYAKLRCKIKLYTDLLFKCFFYAKFYNMYKNNKLNKVMR